MMKNHVNMSVNDAGTETKITPLRMFYREEKVKHNESVYKKTPLVGFGWGHEVEILLSSTSF